MSSGEQFQAAAARLLARYGSLMSFQRYAVVKDKRAGSQTLAPTGAPVQALACVLDAEESRDRGVAAGDQVLLVEGAPFGIAISDRWTVSWGEGERKISNPVTASRSTPAEPIAYYQAFLKAGGSAVEVPVAAE